MIERCYSPTAAKYKYYGERGIVVCDEWRSSINAFRGWALDNGFSPQRTLDRIDTDGPYAPENCRWATPEEQNRNRRPFFTLHGVEDGARRSELVAAANDLLIASGLRQGSISILKDAG